MSSASKLRKMTIDNTDIDKATSRKKMDKLRQDSASHEVIPGRGISKYEEGMAYKKLKAHYEEQNKTKTNPSPPAGGFKKLIRKRSKSKSKSKSKRGRRKGGRSRSKRIY